MLFRSKAFTFCNAYNVFVTGGFVEFTCVQVYGMPQVLHHDTELANLFGVRTSSELFSSVGVRKTDYVKSH